MLKSALRFLPRKLGRLISCLAIIGGLQTATAVQALAATSGACTAVNSSGAFNLSSTSLGPLSSASLTAWFVGDVIHLTFGKGGGGDGVYSGTYAPLSAATSGTLDYTINATDLTNGVRVDPEDFESVTATCTPAPAPTVTGVSPATGPVTGQTSVTITGTGFDAGVGVVTFGGIAATNVIMVNATTITATSPAGAAGTVHVVVATNAGTSPTGAADQFTYFATPAVTAVSPSSGPLAGGNTVTITGVNFTNVTAVKFGSTSVGSVTVNSSTSITAVAPGSSSVGAVDVTVTTSQGTSPTGAADHYTYVAAPTVTAVSPTSGPAAGGTPVTITGTNLTGATAVSFGGAAATNVNVVSATQITATSPAGSAGTIDVTVTTPGGTSTTSAADNYTYIAAPTVTAVSPTSGSTAGGTGVTITGTAFANVSAVTFGSTAATSFNVVSGTTITATSPAGSAGTIDVTVTTLGGTSATSAGDHYTYVAPPAVSVGASSTTITLGDTATFTATVTAASGTPTGLVTFFDASTPIGSGVLNQANPNQAKFSTTLLSAGTHSITAIYDGDANYPASSVSAAVTETVNPRTSTTGVVLNPTTVVVDQSSTANVTLTDSGSVPPGTADAFGTTGAPATGRTGFTSTLFADGLVLVAGGTDANNNVLQSAEIYSVSSAAFSATGNLNTPRTGAVAVLLPTGKVLVAGGSSSGVATNALNTAELFDPSTGTFTAAGSGSSNTMTAARFGATATLLNTGKVLIEGGQNSGGVLNSAELYDPVADTFTATGTLNTARTGASATLLVNGKVLVAGGSSDGTANGALNSAELFDPAGNAGAGTFTAVAGANSTLAAGRWQPEAASLGSGKVLVAGGQNSGGALASVDLYDPVANNFTPSNQQMSQARANGSAVAMPNGMVLLAGGTSSQAVDLYDADSDKFDTTGSLQQSDVGLVSILLNNGDVLVVGLTTAGTPASDAELYAPSFNPSGTVQLISSEATDITTGACTLTPSTGTASTCTSTVATANVATSPHTITATYPADVVHSGSSNTASLTVNRANTTTTVVSSANPSVFGQSVTFTATVLALAPSTGTPTGSVNFTIDGGPPTTVPLASNGGPVLTAILTTSSLSDGSHTITAAYNGTGNFNGSQASLSPAQQVNPAVGPATHFAVSAPATATSGIAFNFTVTALDQNNNTATGYGGTVHITSSDGSAVLPANSTLTNGARTFSVTLKTAGAQIIAATDTANSITGTSNTVTVLPGPATHFTVSAPATAISGTAFNFTVTALDQSNNTATGYSGTVHFTSSDGAAVVPANSALTNGVRTFSATLKTAGSQTITATDTANSSISGTSNAINVLAAPTVTSISPKSGPVAGHTSVTITGTNFIGATAVNFGSAPTSFTVNSATSITATSPAGSGTVDVTVTTPGGTSATSAADQFSYAATPTVTSVSPNAGPLGGGTTVTITGTNLTGATAVAFGTNGATTFTVNSVTSITATSPAGSGTVDITVTTPGGTSAIGATDRFTYTAGPSVSAVSPKAGPTAGGTVVTISGANFTGVTAVNFGSLPAATFTLNSATQITATSPPQSAGTVDVTVTTPGGTSPISSADQFTYAPPPVVTAVAPANGPTLGGTIVSISGTGLAGATAVRFGGTAATSFTVNSDTAITATAPNGTGTVDVMVTTPIGISATSAADQFSYQPSHDFNGDGKSDVLWRDMSNNIGIWLMNGASIMQSSVLGAVPANWATVAQRDFNGDGKSDLLWRDTSGNVGLWLMNGTQVASATVLGLVPTTWSVAGTGDFNADGKGDIVWRDNSGNVGLWLMNGATILQTAVLGNVSTNWVIVGADMKGEIFWRNLTTGEVGLWVVNGTTIAQTVDFGVAPLNWTIAGLGDFDGNGSTDILWRDGSGNVGIWLMNGTKIMSSAVVGPMPLSWTIAEIGDYSGNGKSDIFWTDSSGNVQVWFMNGASIASTATLGNIGKGWAAQSLNAD